MLTIRQNDKQGCALPFGEGLNHTLSACNIQRTYKLTYMKYLMLNHRVQSLKTSIKQDGVI